MSDRYTVFGNPIEHSKSPMIHRHFAAQTNQALVYDKTLTPVDGFSQALAEFFNQGGRGCNITVPFKEQAWQLADQLSDAARKAGAVNTLTRLENGQLQGDNTDGVGLVQDLIANLRLNLAGKKILLLGAGGAVRGVIGPILAQSPASLLVANRTVEKANQLAKIFAEDGNITACGYPQLAGQQFDLVINGTAASLQGELPPLPDDLLANGAACYDMMYSTSDTAFQIWAKSHGAVIAADGLGMLIEQAAQAFYIWRNCRPVTGKLFLEMR
ncbi:shikimate dehydrogenase [Pelagibaculum spongiae]|uniref:Shikimate dehydrogenase (NADP(+)) n=1 Tax=Pelagibaculum spongiae TaxID=2080658 RepID=A0A2V1GV06_9GAMM|nr:shikimate dehydrogenase [Pelagibaculum spongiae]PVZ68171.1 shikimate dehydrogenase [Pelagibaculum spongiae]